MLYIYIYIYPFFILKKKKLNGLTFETQTFILILASYFRHVDPFFSFLSIIN